MSDLERVRQYEGINKIKPLKEQLPTLLEESPDLLSSKYEWGA